MGFTGKEAAAWKERYIEAFNELESRLLVGTSSEEMIKLASVNSESGYKMDLMTYNAAIKVLRISEAGKILMLTKVCALHNRPSSFFPVYTDGNLTKSMTALLKEHGSDISTRKANLIWVGLGFLEHKTRQSSKDKTKKFYSVTVKGLTLGKNLFNPNNEKETQPHWYESKFAELLEMSDNV